MDMSQETNVTVTLQDQIAYLRLLIAHRDRERMIEQASLDALLITLLDVDTAELDIYRQINAELEEALRDAEKENAALRAELEQFKEPL